MKKARRAAGNRFRGLREARPSPAMAVALLALVVAMSGTAIAATQLGKNSVGSRNIKPGAVTSSDLRNGGVRAVDIGAGAVTTPKLAKEAVTAEKLARGSVGGQALANAAVGTAKLDNGAVNSEKLGLGAVLNDKIAAGAVNGESVADGALGTEDFSSTIPAASATATADQSIPNETNTKVVLDAETFDTRNMHSDGAENTKIFAPVDGVYLISGTVEWGFTNNAQGPRVLSIHKNGGPTLAYDARSMDTHEAFVEVLSQTVSTAAVLKAGDYIELEVLQDTTQFPAETHPAVTLENDAKNTPELTIVWLAPGPS